MPELIPRIRTAAFLMIFGSLFGLFAAMLIASLFVTDLGDIEALQLALMVGELLIPVPILLWARRMKSPLQDFFRLHPVRRESIVTAIPIGIGMVILVDELDRIFQKLIPLPGGFDQLGEVMRIHDLWSGMILIGVIVIFGPLVEELIFRGFFQRVLEFRLKDVTRAALISALVFALVHFNPWWIVQIYLIGLLLGYMAWRTNSIWIPAILHAMNNGFSLLFTNSMEELPAWYEWRGHVSPPILIVGAALFFLGMKAFIAVTPVAPRDEDVIFIEEAQDQSRPPI